MKICCHLYLSEIPIVHHEDHRGRFGAQCAFFFWEGLRHFLVFVDQEVVLTTRGCLTSSHSLKGLSLMARSVTQHWHRQEEWKGGSERGMNRWDIKRWRLKGLDDNRPCAPHCLQSVSSPLWSLVMTPGACGLKPRLTEIRLPPSLTPSPNTWRSNQFQMLYYPLKLYCNCFFLICNVVYGF